MIVFSDILFFPFHFCLRVWGECRGYKIFKMWKISLVWAWNQGDCNDNTWSSSSNPVLVMCASVDEKTIVKTQVNGTKWVLNCVKFSKKWSPDRKNLDWTRPLDQKRFFFHHCVDNLFLCIFPFSQYMQICNSSSGILFFLMQILQFP